MNTGILKELQIIIDNEEWGDLRSFLDEHCHPMSEEHADVLGFVLYNYFEANVDFMYSAVDGWCYDDFT